MSGIEAMADATVAAEKEREKARRRAIRTGKIKTVVFAALTSMFILVVIVALGVYIQAHIEAGKYQHYYRCNVCNYRSSVWTNYCRHCGDENNKYDLVRMEDICGDCGNGVFMWDTYCDNCGSKNLLFGEYVTIDSIGNPLVERIVMR